MQTSTRTITVAYIRRSSPDERDGRGEASRDAQERAIAALAARYGVEPVAEVYVDWGRSADEAKLGRRREYLRMLRAIEKGEVGAVVAYALDRLNRSAILSARFAKACEEHGVRIITEREGEVRSESPDEWLRWHVLAGFADYELRVMKRRAKDNTARRRDRGDYLGIAPYGFRVDPATHKLAPHPDEDVDAVVAAYERAGSYAGAAKLLTVDGPAPRSGRHWSDQTVKRILRRDGRVRLPRESRRGAKARADWRLFHLVRCPVDGSTLVALNRKHPQYVCPVGRRDPRHPRPYAVAESIVLPYVLDAVERLRGRLPGDRVRTGGSTSERRTQLEAARERLGWAVADGLLDREAAKTRAVEITAELERLEEADEVVAIPAGLDLRALEPRTLNRILAAAIERVELDERMRPSRVVWRAGVEELVA